MAIVSIISEQPSYLSQEMFLSLYKAMVRPHLEYASVIWSPLYKDKNTLENTQRIATRLVPPLKRKTYSDRLKTLGVADDGIQAREGRHDMMEVYKILNKIDLVNKDKLFKMATYQATRGHLQKVFKKKKKKKKKKTL